MRGFRLVLCADVWNRVADYSVGVLEEAVAAEKADGGFDKRFLEPLVIYSPRLCHTDLNQDLYASSPPSPFPWPEGLPRNGNPWPACIVALFR